MAKTDKDGDTKTFDAGRYVVSLRGKDYLEVKWRLVWLRSEHPDAMIETELVRWDPPLAIFRAKITIPSGGSATGWGQEEAADFGDFLEKAETKAIGRALGALGYGTQFTEDFDFKEDAPAGQRVVDSPVERPQQQQQARPAAQPARAAVGSLGPANREQRRETPPPGQGGRPTLTSITGNQNLNGRPEARPALPATEPQIKAIYAIGRGAAGVDEEAIEARCRELYRVPPQELSRRQASEFIDTLKGPSNN